MRYDNYDTYRFVIEIDSWLIDSDPEKWFNMEMFYTLLEFINRKEYRSRLTKKEWDEYSKLMIKMNRMRMKRVKGV